MTAMEVEEWEREGWVKYEEDENLLLEEIGTEKGSGQDTVAAHPDTVHNLEHPNPYKLRWLNKGVEVKVDKQCLAPYSIVKVYKDEVICDVFPMDAYHLLFGRPWEFDRNTTHQGKENIYSFKHEGKKVTLTPLPPNQRNYGSRNMPEEVNGVLFLSEASMIKELKQEQPMMMLLSNEVVGKESSEVPAEIEPLILRYKDVFPKELPSGQSPP
ncbi:uncharacterized protein LOC141595399 [Silene latifolia]|uniref:uncharacterized protein LOC141595399 n=1 Tax=Silene latifolia TaxID=37657 RepID=UPI003D77113E